LEDVCTSPEQSFQFLNLNGTQDSVRIAVLSRVMKRDQEDVPPLDFLLLPAGDWLDAKAMLCLFTASEMERETESAPEACWLQTPQLNPTVLLLSCTLKPSADAERFWY